MRALRMTRHRIALQVRNGTAMTFAYYVSMLLVLWIGGELTIAGTITLGDQVLFAFQDQIILSSPLSPGLIAPREQELLLRLQILDNHN